MIISNPRPQCHALYSAPPIETAGDYTVGTSFLLLYPNATIYGIEFTTGITVPCTMKCCLWAPVEVGTPPYPLPTRTVNVACTGPGVYQAIFSAPYVVTPTDFATQRGDGADYRLWVISIYETSGSYYCERFNSWIYFAAPVMLQLGCITGNHNNYAANFMWAAGDALPDTASGSASLPFMDAIIDYEVEEYDADPPTVSLVSPLDGSINVAPSTSITIDVTDSVSGVNDAVTEITIEGVIVWQSDAATGGYSGTKSLIVNGYRYTLTPSAPFNYGQHIDILVDAEDTSGLSTSTSFSFTTISLGILNLQCFFEVSQIVPVETNFPVKTFWNPFDDHAAIASLTRNQGEKNYLLKRRIKDRFANLRNSSHNGILNSLTADLGLNVSKSLFINPKVINNEFFAPDPFIFFDGAYLYLYSDYKNGILDYQIDRYTKGGNFEYLYQLVNLINSTVFFEAHIEPNIDWHLRSMCLFNQSNRIYVEDEVIPSSNKFYLQHKRIVPETIYFSNRDTFRILVDTEEEVLFPGQFYVDHVNGIVRVYSVPQNKITVRYYYTIYPFIAKSSPIILCDINNSGFKHQVFEQVEGDNGSLTDGLLTRLGVDIINELLTLKGGGNWNK